MSKRVLSGSLEIVVPCGITYLTQDLWKEVISHIPVDDRVAVFFELLGTCRDSVGWLTPLINKEITGALETMGIWSSTCSATKKLFLETCLGGEKLTTAWAYSLALSIANLVKLEKLSLPYVRDMKINTPRCKWVYDEVEFSEVFYHDVEQKKIVPVVSLDLMQMEVMPDSDGLLYIHYKDYLATDTYTKAIENCEDDRAAIFNSVSKKLELQTFDPSNNGHWYTGVYDGEHVLGHSRLEFRSNCYIYKGGLKSDKDRRQAIWVYANSREHGEEIASIVHKYGL